jgi:sugar lactone lactonase YvrE
MADSISIECVWSVQAELGEGPFWSAPDSALWFVDIKKDRIHRYEPSTGRKRNYATPPSPSFLVAEDGGTFVVGLKSGLHRFDPKTGDFALLLEVEPELPGNRLNDGALDPKGRLWFGSMDDGERQSTGSLFRLTAGGPVAVDRGYVITNGPCFSPNGRILYHTDTRAGTIFAFDVADDGGVSDKRVFVKIEEGAGHPDGSVTDAEGCLWVVSVVSNAMRKGPTSPRRAERRVSSRGRAACPAESSLEVACVYRRRRQFSRLLRVRPLRRSALPPEE